MNLRLQAGNKGSFTVMQLTDSHTGEDAGKNARTAELIEQLIAWEKPDFIVHTGDAVWGERSEEQIREALLPLSESGIPWTYVFGNHDAEAAHNKDRLFECIRKMPNCRMWHDEGSGSDRLGNHYLEVCNGAGQVMWVLFFLDSGEMYPDPRVGGYAVIGREQIDWYRRVSARYASENPGYAAMLFQHIALPEFREMWEMETTYGMKREEVCCPRINTGFFSALVEDGHARGVFVGHDHTNDFWGTRFGVALGYGRQSGYGGYSADDFLKGCRMFRLSCDEGQKKAAVPSFETYLRLEDGRQITSPWKREPEYVRHDL
ncbi:MAG: metallophosphoesterase family protein [Clostridia bacterium]|nr:metallophosphoesterase family protein [Clostridia bacterium]